MPDDHPMFDIAAAEDWIRQFLSRVLSTSGLLVDFDIQIQKTRSSLVDAQSPAIQVFFEGPDTPLLVQRRGQLLLALDVKFQEVVHSIEN